MYWLRYCCGKCECRFMSYAIKGRAGVRARCQYMSSTHDTAKDILIVLAISMLRQLKTHKGSLATYACAQANWHH
jgi:hypothetical protein